MKRIIYLFVAALGLSAMTACEDFLNREPINKFSAESYFQSESELKMYTDGMLNSWMPDPSEDPGTDAYCDVIATKTSTDFFRADVQWDDVKQGGWSWGFLRSINYMLTRMPNAKGKVSEQVYNHYEGVARFWRAYHYSSRVRTFSDVPWVDKYLDANDEDILYGPRDDREYVFSKIVEDLEFARANVTLDDDSRNRINNAIVNALASRIYLYEGTFRKNVKNNPATGKPWNNEYEKADDLIRLAGEAAKAVIDSKKFGLSANFAALFISPTVDAKEVLWARSYVEGVTGKNSATRYYNSATLGQQYSGTKDLVRMYLKTDGTPVLTGEQSINEEFKDRDTRLAATVLGPGRMVSNLQGQKVEQAINCTFCKTGYMLVKWCIPDEVHFQNAIDETTLPLLRYPEVLLNYAEAMELQGMMTEDIWNQTVGALRERAGVKNVYPASAAYVKDQWLRDYYTMDVKNVPANLSDVALEIRRERVTELILENGLRQSDLYRYGQCDLIERRFKHQGWAGLWLSDDDVAKGFSFAGKTYTMNTTVKENKELLYPIHGTANTDWSLEPAETKGYYLVYNYKLNWEDKMYSRPIPQTATNINPNLGQNFGW